jgi:hypothetical protein
MFSSGSPEVSCLQDEIFEQRGWDSCGTPSLLLTNSIDCSRASESIAFFCAWKGSEVPESTGALPGGDALAGEALAGDPLGGDALPGDPLGGDALAGEALAGDPFGGDALGGDALGGLHPPAMTVRKTPRTMAKLLVLARLIACIMRLPERLCCPVLWS